MSLRNYFITFNILFLLFLHHFVEFFYRSAQVMVERGVGSQEVAVAPGKGCIEFLVHPVGVFRYGVFYVVLLPVHRGVGVYALLLVEEAVGCFYGVACNHLS